MYFFLPQPRICDSYDQKHILIYPRGEKVPCCLNPDIPHRQNHITSFFFLFVDPSCKCRLSRGVTVHHEAAHKQAASQCRTALPCCYASNASNLHFGCNSKEWILSILPFIIVVVILLVVVVAVVVYEVIFEIL